MPGTYIRAGAGAAFFVMVGVIVSAGAYRFFVDISPPAMKIEKIHLESDVIRAGDPLVIKFTSSRMQDCRAITHRWIVDDATEISIWGAVSPSIMTNIGEHQNLSVSFRTPEWIKPGQYRYQSITYNTDCPHGRSYTVASPILKFTVVK